MNISQTNYLRANFFWSKTLSDASAMSSDRDLALNKKKLTLKNVNITPDSVCQNVPLVDSYHSREESGGNQKKYRRFSLFPKRASRQGSIPFSEIDKVRLNKRAKSLPERVDDKTFLASDSSRRDTFLVACVNKPRLVFSS